MRLDGVEFRGMQLIYQAIPQLQEKSGGRPDKIVFFVRYQFSMRICINGGDHGSFSICPNTHCIVSYITPDPYMEHGLCSLDNF